MSTIELNANQLYAVKESHNLAMLSSATAAASLLNASIWITDPSASVSRIMDYIYADLSPSVFVKVSYTGDMDGAAVLIFKADDAQLMLNQLMGMPLTVSPDFTFDEINTSAFNEVISQMMASYFTEISSITGLTLAAAGAEVIPNSANQNLFSLMGLNPDDTICAVTSAFRIDNAVNSRFATVIPAELAEIIAEKTAERFPMPEEPEPSAPVPDFSSSPEENNPFDTTGSEETGSVFDITPEESAFGAALDQPSAFSGLAEQNRSFTSFQNTLNEEQLRNLQLIMNVPLELSIEIGSTQKRVDEILSFSYGTVIELDSLADAPVNVIVNGHLIAKGDVVVVDDYFAVRITEIVKSDLLDTLSTKE
ncbi:flagellar motor switch protein FliN [Ruminococcus sp. HUN007]|uniref:flagellar motor switch protein FliN n=1 Tax=Ruminococcus sp. HUN007 TaxID=1514668 RepID=UPI0005D1E2E1|nr:flagellar motor switch protein FliN [Ruminococcus sp. HUN007]